MARLRSGDGVIVATDDEETEHVLRGLGYEEQDAPKKAPAKKAAAKTESK